MGNAKSQKPPAAFADHYKQVTTLIESVKTDNITQFGEIKKEFGGVTSQLANHDQRITDLERDKIARDAIEQYKKSHPDSSSAAYNAKRKQDDVDNGSVTVNKELLNALKVLGVVVAALAAAILALKAGQ